MHTLVILRQLRYNKAVRRDQAVNINEIAKLAGVSRATVSRYMNNGYVSEEKRALIKKVIQETGYQPSNQAQTLRTKKTKLVGVILPKINSHTVSRMVSGIGDELSKRGYQLLLANTNNDLKEELNYLSVFKENRVDGIIFIATIFTANHKKMLKECRVPVVILGQYLQGYCCVYHDDFNAAGTLMDLLLEKGKVPGYIGVTERDEAVGKNRRRGVEASLSKHGITCREDQMQIGDFSVESGYEKMKELLQKVPDVDSVFCATDNIASGAMLYLRECGKKIPEEIQIAGMGNTQVSRILAPPLTTVCLHYKTSGREAAKMLIECMEDEKTIVKELKIGYDIVRNQSIR